MNINTQVWGGVTVNVVKFAQPISESRQQGKKGVDLITFSPNLNVQ